MKFNYLSMAAVSMLLGSALAGCSSDSILNDEPQIAEKDMQLFIKVAIADPGNTSTRAEVDNTNNEDLGNYTDGTDAERTIHSVLFVFYDDKGKYINAQEIKSDKFTTSAGTGNIETTLKIIVPVDIKEGQGMPSSVMAYVNPTPVASTSVNQAFGNALLLTRDLEQVVPSSIVPSTVGQDHTGFTMTNSVYYDNTKPNNGPIIAATVPENALFEDRTSAENDNNASKEITIYVERVVAKVTLTNTTDAFKSDEAKKNNYIKIGDYELSFVPLAWAVNNLEKETFLIKNFRSGDKNGNQVTSITNLDYSAANATTAMGDLVSPPWNYYLPSDDSNLDKVNNGHRTFWAYSRTYFNGGNYPQTADEYNSAANTYDLYYLRYNTIKNGNKGWALQYNNGFSDKDCIYTLENTMRPSVIANNMGRVMSSATIVGYYNLKKDGAEITEGTEAASFYISRGDGKPENYKIWEEGAMKTEFMDKNSVIFINKSTTETEDLKKPGATEVGSFVVTHPSPEVYGSGTLASRHVTLQLTEEAAETGNFYYTNSNGVKVKITTDNLNDANYSLYYSLTNELGMIEGFKNGMAYFNVPIKHIWAKAGDDLGSATLGEYGVVRNHAYNIEITGIQGLGTGVEDPTDPIIPVVDQKQYYVKTKIHVQRWRIVPKQSVILK